MGLLTAGVSLVLLQGRVPTWQIGSFVVSYCAHEQRSLQTP